MKATHNGHCQVCGRLQAAKGTDRSMTPLHWVAKHGYKVTDWGFSGTCHGSDHRPVEEETDVASDAIRTFGSKAIGLAAMTIADIDTVLQTSYDRRLGRSIPVRLNQGEWAFCAWHGCGRHRSHWDWSEDVARELFRCHQQALRLQEHVAFLQNLIKTRHGQPLIERTSR